MAAGSKKLYLTMKILLFANTAWYLYNFRLPLAKVLQSMGHEVILVSPFDKYSKRLEQTGFRWIEFPLSRKGMNPVREIASILKLFNLYKKEKPDLVHHFTIKCVLYGSIVAKWIKIRMIVNSITGLGYMFTGNSLAQRLLRPITILLYRIALG
ncbi:MAG: glycosyltransferase family 4 protein, partial [Leptolinea sp.]|nr:glycosyltransferase family 4 protein [Leptolinea sp.]